METIHENSRVTLKFRMQTRLPDETVKEHPEEEFTFIYGVENQVPTLETALEGRPAGTRMRLEIPGREIYGAHDPELIREIPREGLIKQRLKEGQFYRQIKKGCLVSFKVLEIRPHTVVADFNKPMAGIGISMDLEVLAVREASEQEVRAAKDSEKRRRIGCG